MCKAYASPKLVIRVGSRSKLSIVAVHVVRSSARLAWPIAEPQERNSSTAHGIGSTLVGENTGEVWTIHSD